MSDDGMGAMGDDVRARAISRLKARSHFWQLFFIWIALAVFFIIIWAVSGGTTDGIDGFWPIWPILGIGLGVVVTAFRTFGKGAGGPTEGQIQAEMKRLSE
ncbi:2TM domain-containing protein [Microbacterium sp. LRZ72]|uniref:2TM domain-containing protein n=1 Tax=Microbacterium sp. LRZ72 TaxID=2942481 RepID=UPI0029A3BEDA|nr:2TM domain-containing protein [Microbacterium sp. LRZ72]MDX2377382.1 2TM domain-containing protein [Microbacterium sp. LRZ72]